jgi:hypothetical protein
MLSPPSDAFAVAEAASRAAGRRNYRQYRASRRDGEPDRRLRQVYNAVTSTTRSDLPGVFFAGPFATGAVLRPDDARGPAGLRAGVRTRPPVLRSVG